MRRDDKKVPQFLRISRSGAAVLYLRAYTRVYIYVPTYYVHMYTRSYTRVNTSTARVADCTKYLPTYRTSNSDSIRFDSSIRSIDYRLSIIVSQVERISTTVWNIYALGWKRETSACSVWRREECGANAFSRRTTLWR